MTHCWTGAEVGDGLLEHRAGAVDGGGVDVGVADVTDRFAAAKEASGKSGVGLRRGRTEHRGAGRWRCAQCQVAMTVWPPITRSPGATSAVARSAGR
ncbi:hypothetical protein GCM10020218_004820 [Dactylosporangium vinaceum]